MPNVHAPEKESVSLYLPRTLLAKLKRAAQQRHQTLTEYLTQLFTDATANILLSPSDLQAITHATRLAQAKRARHSTRLADNPHPRGKAA